MLDLCVLGSVAPGAKIFLYFTEFTSQGWVDAVHRIATDGNDCAVLSISYGDREDDPQGAWTGMGIHVVDQAFEAAMARGITICCASGDDGSRDQGDTGVHADFPASSPNVLGVGGTKLVARSPTEIDSEVVWSAGAGGGGAGGGGVSAVFARPSYQDGANVPASAGAAHPAGRGVPDVAAVADPGTGMVVMHVSGQLQPVGGTSAAAPLWAALVARLNQVLGARCGVLNSPLYAKAAREALNDIVRGSNGAYSATVGWDPCTGLGTPNGQKLLAALRT
jgi:kumamolisin